LILGDEKYEGKLCQDISDIFGFDALCSTSMNKYELRRWHVFIRNRVAPGRSIVAATIAFQYFYSYITLHAMAQYDYYCPDLRCDLFSHDVTRYELLMRNDTAMDFFSYRGLENYYLSESITVPVVCVQAITQYK